MMKVVVPFKDRSYDCVIEDNLLLNIENHLDTNKETVIITDEGIPKQHINKIRPKFNDPFVITIPQGEPSKSMETASLLLEKMIEHNISRAGQVLALGGGVVGDLAGFVASIYKRGMDYFQVPTTLLAQIDSSVGGKVAVNSKTVKNAIGAFKQPQKVLIDPLVLETLDERQFSNGIGEMVKYGIISRPTLLDALLNEDIRQDMSSYIKACIEIKRDVVLEDEFDVGIRQILNYGHTLGHAIEQHSNYEILHGEAISIGMMWVSKNESFHPLLKKILEKYHLPTDIDYDVETLLPYIKSDKKIQNNTLNFIQVKELGNPLIKQIRPEEIKQYVR